MHRFDFPWFLPYVADTSLAWSTTRRTEVEKIKLDAKRDEEHNSNLIYVFETVSLRFPRAAASYIHNRRLIKVYYTNVVETAVPFGRNEMCNADMFHLQSTTIMKIQKQYISGVLIKVMVFQSFLAGMGNTA